MNLIFLEILKPEKQNTPTLATLLNKDNAEEWISLLYSSLNGIPVKDANAAFARLFYQCLYNSGTFFFFPGFTFALLKVAAMLVHSSSKNRKSLGSKCNTHAGNVHVTD